MKTPIQRILIVDDDEHVAQGIQRALTLHGYAAEACGSAEAALERLSKGSWGLVISDLRLPGLDGLQLLRLVIATWPDVRRILITGFGTPDTELRACQEADDYLIKPFSIQRLLQAVRQLIPPPDLAPSDV